MIPEAIDLINTAPWESDGTQSTLTFDTAEKLMIEFAKLHVKAALEACQKEAKITEEPETRMGQTRYKSVIDYDSILNAYPDSNII